MSKTITKLITKILGSKYLVALLCGLVVLFLCAVGAFKRVDKWAQDVLYQHPQATSNAVRIIGIDEKTLEELGAYNTWDRSVMAQALEVLASDPEQMPAVVAIDTLYASETDPEADARLVEAVKKLPCVVTATTATFGTTEYFDENGDRVKDYYEVAAYEEPFPALKEVTTQGHINAMYDPDGILRHAILYVELPTGERAYSMAFETARSYARSKGKAVSMPETDARGHFYVSFSEKPGEFADQISLCDVINGKIPANYFAGRIVLIGPYAVGLQDAYYTSIERAVQMYGVEYQANVIEAVLNGDYKIEIEDWVQFLLVLVICFGVYLLFDKCKILSSTISMVVLVAGFLGLSLLLYRKGYITHILWIPIGIFLAYLISVALGYLQSAREKARVTRTFERYVAPEIVGEILKGGTEALELGGRLCDIAVLFVDIRGFTTMSERLDPEKVVYILNKYLDMTSECIERNRGTLDKFVGDATMAFWGAPLPVEDPVYLAAKTAMDIVHGAERVSNELKEEVGEEFKCGVGVHFGPAVVGNMGAARRMDYTAIGDTVNTSARLEANAPGGVVYISRAVVDALGDRVTYSVPEKPVKLKGKADGFEVLKMDTLDGVTV